MIPFIELWDNKEDEYYLHTRSYVLSLSGNTLNFAEFLRIQDDFEDDDVNEEFLTNFESVDYLRFLLQGMDYGSTMFDNLRH